MAGRTSLTVYEGMTGMMENAFINVKNQSLTITAEVEIPKGGAKGVILCQGGKFGGWTFYVKDGKPAYAYNWLGLERYTVSATKPLAPGKSTIVFDFAYDGGGRGKGGTGTLSVNGRQVAKGRIEKTQANIFSLDDAADVGVDEGTPVTKAYQERNNKFTGKIHSVTIQLKEMKRAAADELRQAMYEASRRKALAD
jgi:arylsulfatase